MTVSFVSVYFWATFPAGAKAATLFGPIRLQPAPVATPAHTPSPWYRLLVFEFGAKTVITQFLMNIQQLANHQLATQSLYLSTGSQTDAYTCVAFHLDCAVEACTEL